MPSKTIIDTIVDTLDRAGFHVFYRHLNPRYESFAVMSVYIPGLDRFHLIRSGNIVAPQSWLQHDRP